MQRKMAAGRSGGTVSGRALLRALRLAMARSAFDALELPLQVIGAAQDRRPLDELGLDNTRLLIVLDGPGGQVGVACMDAQSITALTQHQTMGKVTGGEPADRPFTATDAALAAPLLDTLFRKAPLLVEQETDRRCLAGYRFGARVEDVQSLMLLLDAPQFRAFELTLEFTEGPSQGVLSILVPEPPAIDKKQKSEHEKDMTRKSLGAVRAELTANIGRIKIPLATLAAMKPGDLLTLDDPHLDATVLRDISGRQVTTGRLGQMDGMRAIRVNEGEERSSTSTTQFTGSMDLGGGPPQMAADGPGGLPPMPDMGDIPPLEPAGLPPLGDMGDSPGGWDDDGGLPALPDVDGGLPDLPDLPPLDGGDNDLPPMSVDETALEITQLAGLSEEEDDDLAPLPSLQLPIAGNG